MKLIGYARVSSSDQNLERQIAALRSAGCDVIFREKVSGRDIQNRPQLEKAIDALGIGWVLVVAEWDRATRSMMDGIEIMQRIAARDAYIKVLDKPHLDLTSPVGRGLLAFLSAIAQDERERIVKRATDGWNLAKARGVKMGRKHKLTSHQRRLAMKMLGDGQTHREIGKFFNVSHRTIGRIRLTDREASIQL